MRAFFGIISYLLSIPVSLWICYRCLEQEPEIWKRGKYGLLVLWSFSGLFYFCGFLTGENGQMASDMGDALKILLMVGFFLMTMLWAEKGIGVFVKSLFFLGIYQGLCEGIQKGIRLCLGLGGFSFESREYFFLSLGTVMVTALCFFGGAFVLNRGFYEKLPKRLVRLLVFVWLIYDLAVPFGRLGTAAKTETRGVFLALVVLLLAAMAGSMVLLKKQSIRRRSQDGRQWEKLFREYYSALERLDKSRYTVFCSNPMLNALLNRKKEVCQRRKIRTDIDLTQFEGGYIETTEWVRLFILLFDQAMEALSRGEKGRERSVHVKAKCAGGFEMIVVRYSGKGNPYEKKLGMHRLSAFAEKYGGSAIYKEDKGNIQITVSLQVREKRQEKLL